ncbi:MAG: hypothetical protein WKF71_16260 [Pyrinomonadaceae bacterium]
MKRAAFGKDSNRKKRARRKGKEVDIKFGAGGMLDIYFAVRFPAAAAQSCPMTPKIAQPILCCKNFRTNDFLNEEDFQNFSSGYEFLSELDHNLRLTVGRSTQLPICQSKGFEHNCKKNET